MDHHVTAARRSPSFVAPLSVTPALDLARRRPSPSHPDSTTQLQRPPLSLPARRCAPPGAPRRLVVVGLAGGRDKAKRNMSPTVVNKPARFRYEVLEKYECGIELLGTEIKSVRMGSLNLRDGFARVTKGELFLHNVHIGPWQQATAMFNHEPLRVRRLLLHRRTTRKLAGKQAEAGLTLVPLRAYFSDNGYLKIEIGLCRGKQLHDRREDIKKRDDERNMRRVGKAIVSGL